MDEITKSRIAEAIAKQLPSEVVTDIVKSAIESAIRDLSWQTRDIQNLVQQAIVDRTQELLKTQFKDQVESQSQILAARVVSELIKAKISY